MTVILGFIIFVLCVVGWIAARTMRGHIARLRAVVERQEADLLTCVEAQRHMSNVLSVYSETLDQAAASCPAEQAELVAALTRRLALQSNTFAQALSHWDGLSDPRETMLPEERATDVDRLVAESGDLVLQQLWHVRRPEDVARMVQHLVSMGLGMDSAAEAALAHTGLLHRDLSTLDVVALWQRPRADVQGAAHV